MQRRRRREHIARPHRHSSPSKLKRFSSFLNRFTGNFDEYFKELCNPTSKLAVYCIFLSLIFDACLSWLIVSLRSYTEIDWSTYMQQVESYVQGERNYSKIEGDTGPIVYPAGHLHVYHLLYSFTNFGKNLLKAQYIFVGIYLLNQATVYYVFFKSRRIPPFLYFFVTLFGYRIHSIYMLRMFNDGIAMFLCFLSIAIFVSTKPKASWLPVVISSLCFSAAISIKMNVLLFAPFFYFTFLIRFGYIKCFVAGITAAMLQIILATPFLLYSPMDYLSKAFNFKRVFLYVWTVNWRMFPEWLFLHPTFHKTLFLFHVGFLAIFFIYYFWRINKDNTQLYAVIKNPTLLKLSNHEILMGLFISNLLGIAFSRSLHYQFYSWYYHTIPYILFSWQTRKEKTDTSSLIVRATMRLVIMAMVEYCWNTYPSTKLSSTLLSICHLILILLGWSHV